MADEKISVSWDELNQAKVDRRLKEQEAIARTKKYSQMEATDLPKSAQDSRRASIWYNAVFALAAFGLLGGLLAWGIDELLHIRPDQLRNAAEFEGMAQSVRGEFISGRITEKKEQQELASLSNAGRDNPYFMVFMNDKLSDDQKKAETERLLHDDQMRTFIMDLVAYGVCGIMISVCLSIAEPIVDRNWPALVINGSVGALLGLLGGAASAFVIGRVHEWVIGEAGGDSTAHRVLAWVVTLATLGSLLTIGPGLVMRNLKRLLIGVCGGLIGGAIGGLLYIPVESFNDHFSKLVTFAAIGLVAGAATGFIEQAAKTGWVKVVSGLIAGKQFILYRNPTYIGSAPDCQIYLFKDPQVGRRHAAIHVVKGGFDLEDLPLGGKTLVNGSPVTRTRLRTGDKIQVGSTGFIFQQKLKKA